MRPADWVRIVSLAAIWGASFLLIRIASPALGPAPTAVVRLLVGGGLLAIYVRVRGESFGLRRNWRQYLLLGVVNSGLPFLCNNLAALTVPASYLTVLNATTPFMGTLMAAGLMREKVTARQGIALGLALAGVGMVAGLGPLQVGFPELLGIAGGLAGAALYAAAALLIQRMALTTPANAQASVSQLAAGLVLAPLWGVFPGADPLDPKALVAALVLGAVCSGIAYMLYFRLVVDIGARRTLTVTFLSPPFGILWSVLVLGEEVTALSLAGTALIVIGTAILLGAGRRAGNDPIQ